MTWKLLVLVALLCAGAFFLSEGITGLVISQTCCTGDSCPREYLCDYAEPVLEQPQGSQSWAAASIGVTFLAAASAYFSFHRMEHRRNRL
jgi:hypothetical protein